MMIKAIALAALATFATSCKKSDKTEPAAKTEPAKTDPAPATPPPATPPPATPPAAPPVAAANALMEKVQTGGQPTDAQLEQAKKDGVKTVINLRSEAELKDYATEEAKAKELGLTYVHIPINGKTGEGLNEANARKLGELLAAENKPVLLHCATGQRVGALLALRAFYVDGAAPDVALQAGKANGLSKPELEKIVTDTMAKKGS